MENKYFLELENISKSFGTLKIVHFTDILYGSTTDIETIKKIVNENIINYLKYSFEITITGRTPNKL